MKIVRYIAEKVDKMVVFWAFVSGFVLLGASLITSYDVVMRYVFRSPTIWALELSQYSLLLATFLGGSFALETKSYVAVDFVKNRMPKNVQRILDVLSTVVIVFTFMLLGWLSTKFTYVCFLKNWTTSTPLRVPIYLPLLLIPIGSFLMVLKQISCQIKENQL